MHNMKPSEKESRTLKICIEIDEVESEVLLVTSLKDLNAKVKAFFENYNITDSFVQNKILRRVLTSFNRMMKECYTAPVYKPMAEPKEKKDPPKQIMVAKMTAPDRVGGKAELPKLPFPIFRNMASICGGPQSITNKISKNLRKPESDRADLRSHLPNSKVPKTFTEMHNFPYANSRNTAHNFGDLAQKPENLVSRDNFYKPSLSQQFRKINYYMEGTAVDYIPTKRMTNTEPAEYAGAQFEKNHMVMSQDISLHNREFDSNPKGRFPALEPKDLMGAPRRTNSTTAVLFYPHPRELQSPTSEFQEFMQNKERSAETTKGFIDPNLMRLTGRASDNSVPIRHVSTRDAVTPFWHEKFKKPEANESSVRYSVKNLFSMLDGMHIGLLSQKNLQISMLTVDLLRKLQPLITKIYSGSESTAYDIEDFRKLLKTLEINVTSD